MEKPTKNIITRESIEKKLYSDNTASLRHTVFVFFVFVLLFGAISAVFIASIFEMPNVWLGLIPAFIAAAVTVPVWVMLARLIKDFIERKHLKKGDLEIVVCPLLYKSQKEVRIYCNKRIRWQTRSLFHFEGFNEFWASPGMYQNFTWGDEFYLVYYKGSKKIKLAYSLKLYEYKEDKK